MMKSEDMKALERQIRPWLEKMGIPQQNYRNLPPSYQDLLHDLICTQTHRPSPRERRDLYRKLCLPESVAGRDSADPVDFMTDEELQKFFSPLTPGERLPYLSKF